MRPIKFRIWHGSKFVTYSDTYIRTSDGSLWYSEEDYGGTFSSHEKLYSFDGKIQQYTGLKDKNGKDIYEGDILYRSQADSYWKVEYSEEEGAFILVDMYNESWGFLALRHDSEIVGNIFENQELLDKTKKL